MERTAAYKRAFLAVTDLFSDTSVSHEQTQELLEALRDEISDLLSALEDDS